MTVCWTTIPSHPTPKRPDRKCKHKPKMKHTRGRESEPEEACNNYSTWKDITDEQYPSTSFYRIQFFHGVNLDLCPSQAQIICGHKANFFPTQSPLRVTPDSVNMSCVMLGVLGVCVRTWLRTGVILSLIVLMVVGISGVLTGMLLDCLLRRARLLVRWFAVLLFPQLLSVVGSLLTFPPLAFGTTAPNLARLIMLLGNVSIVLVLSLNLPSFCLLGMVGLWRIRVLTLPWCKVGWLRCNSQSGLLCTSKWRLCSFAWSGYLACFGFARVHPPLRLSRFRWLPLGVPWVVRFSLASPGFGLGCLFWGSPLSFPRLSLVCRGAVCAWRRAGRLGPPDAMEWLVVGGACCWRGRFWLLALLLLPPQLLCAVQLGAVQIKVHTPALFGWGFFCIRAIGFAVWHEHFGQHWGAQVTWMINLFEFCLQCLGILKVSPDHRHDKLCFQMFPEVLFGNSLFALRGNHKWLPATLNHLLYQIEQMLKDVAFHNFSAPGKKHKHETTLLFHQDVHPVSTFYVCPCLPFRSSILGILVDIHEYITVGLWGFFSMISIVSVPRFYNVRVVEILDCDM